MSEAEAEPIIIPTINTLGDFKAALMDICGLVVERYSSIPWTLGGPNTIDVQREHGRIRLSRTMMEKPGVFKVHIGPRGYFSKEDFDKKTIMVDGKFDGETGKVNDIHRVEHSYLFRDSSEGKTTVSKIIEFPATVEEPVKITNRVGETSDTQPKEMPLNTSLRPEFALELTNYLIYLMTSFSIPFTVPEY